MGGQRRTAPALGVRRHMAMAMLLAVVAAPGVAQSAAATDEHACDPAFEHDTYGSVQYCPIWMPTRGYVPVHALGSGRPVEVGRLTAAGKANWFICQMNYVAIDYTAPGTGYRNTWWALTISDDGHKAWVSEVYFRGGDNYEPDRGLRQCGTDQAPSGSGAPPSTRPETRPEGNEPGSPSSGRRRWSWWGGGVKRARFKGTTTTKCYAYFGVQDWGDRLEPQVRGKCSVKGRGSVGLLIAELYQDGWKIGKRTVCRGPRTGRWPADASASMPSSRRTGRTPGCGRSRSAGASRRGRRSASARAGNPDVPHGSPIALAGASAIVRSTATASIRWRSWVTSSSVPS